MLQGFIDIDINGKKWTEEAHSFVSNFLHILFCMGKPANTWVIKNDAGTAIDPYSGTPRTGAQMHMTGALQYGIVVGTGTNVQAPSDFKLQSLIPIGSAAGQLQYSTMNFNPFSISGNQSIISMSRTFTNSSGGTITINELGLSTGIYSQSPAGWWTVYIVRDKLVTPVTINDGQAATISYRLITTT